MPDTTVPLTLAERLDALEAKQANLLVDVNTLLTENERLWAQFRKLSAALTGAAGGLLAFSEPSAYDEGDEDEEL